MTQEQDRIPSSRLRDLADTLERQHDHSPDNRFVEFYDDDFEEALITALHQAASDAEKLAEVQDDYLRCHREKCDRYLDAEQRKHALVKARATLEQPTGAFLKEVDDAIAGTWAKQSMPPYAASDAEARESPPSALARTAVIRHTTSQGVRAVIFWDHFAFVGQCLEADIACQGDTVGRVRELLDRNIDVTTQIATADGLKFPGPAPQRFFKAWDYESIPSPPSAMGGAELRRRVLEDAARLCENLGRAAGRVGGSVGESLGGLIARSEAATYPYRQCADRIRALASPPPPSEPKT